jgi:Zn-dependent protease
MGGIGLPGGAVYIETWRLRSKKWRSAVSLAGPFANFILVIVLALFLQIRPFAMSGIYPGLAFLALLQIYALILNLIPVPPFDGFGAIEPYLSPSFLKKIAPFRGMMIWVVIAVLWYVPAVSNGFSFVIFFLADLLNIPFDLVGIGYQEFFFWK